MRRTLSVLVALTVAAQPKVCLAVLHVGPEFQINTYTTGAQQGNFTRSSIARSSDGSFVVVWSSYGGQDGAGAGVEGQRFDSAGAAVGTEFQINSYTTSNQSMAAVSAAPDGSFVVVWMSEQQNSAGLSIRGQRYDSSGAATGTEFKVNTAFDYYHSFPSVASGADGRFVVAWGNFLQDGNAMGLFAQRYDAGGAPAGTEFQVNTYTTGNQELPRMSFAPDGSFVVVWQGAGSAGTVHGRRFDAAGAPLGTDFQIASYTTAAQVSPSVSTAPDGSFVVVWDDLGLMATPGPDGSFAGVEGQRFDSSGAPVGTEFQVNTYTTDNQSAADVSHAADGSFVVTWQSFAQDHSGYAIRGQRFDPIGAAEDLEFHVNTFTTGTQYRASVSSAADGTFVVVWSSLAEDGSSFGVFGQRFNLLPGTTTTTNTTTTTTMTTTTSSSTTTVPSTTTTTNGGGTTTTLEPSACSSTPLMNCLTPGSASLQIKDNADPAKDQLSWKWKKGPLVQQMDLGNPNTTTTYTLCVYDSSGGVDSLETALTIEPNAAWDDKDPKGWSYKDKTGAEDGVQKVQIKAGAVGKSSAQIRAKGANVPMPTPFSLTEIFDQGPRVTVQLINDATSTCWSSVFTTAKKDTHEQFKAP